jgi:hypothetical protein
MASRSFDSPVLFMKVGDPQPGADMLSQEPTLGQAIAHVMQQPRDDHWLFDIVTEDGLITFTHMRDIARSEAYVIWQAGQAA